MDEKTKKQVQKLIDESIKRYNKSTAFVDRKLTDTPTDALQVVNKAYVDAGRQYSAQVDYTSTQTVTISPGFMPKELFCYAIMLNTTLSPAHIGISNGQAGKTSSTAGICANMRITQDVDKNILYGLGTFNDRVFAAPGYSATVNIIVTSWTNSSVVFDVTCAANWTISTSITVIG